MAATCKIWKCGKPVTHRIWRQGSSCGKWWDELALTCEDHAGFLDELWAATLGRDKVRVSKLSDYDKAFVV